MFLERATIGLGGAFLRLGARLNFHRMYEDAIAGFDEGGVARRQAGALEAVGLGATRLARGRGAGGSRAEGQRLDEPRNCVDYVRADRTAVRWAREEACAALRSRSSAAGRPACSCCPSAASAQDRQRRPRAADQGVCAHAHSRRRARTRIGQGAARSRARASAWTAKATSMTAAGSSGRAASRFSSTPRPTRAADVVARADGDHRGVLPHPGARRRADRRGGGECPPPRPDRSRAEGDLRQRRR